MLAVHELLRWSRAQLISRSEMATLLRQIAALSEHFGPFGFLEADEVDVSLRIDEERTIHEIAVLGKLGEGVID